MSTPPKMVGRPKTPWAKTGFVGIVLVGERCQAATRSVFDQDHGIGRDARISITGSDKLCRTNCRARDDRGIVALTAFDPQRPLDFAVLNIGLRIAIVIVNVHVMANDRTGDLQFAGRRYRRRVIVRSSPMLTLVK